MEVFFLTWYAVSFWTQDSSQSETWPPPTSLGQYRTGLSMSSVDIHEYLLLGVYARGEILGRVKSIEIVIVVNSGIADVQLGSGYRLYE